mgnify:CR=1 FL=1|jgi:hypothetical protein
MFSIEEFGFIRYRLVCFNNEIYAMYNTTRRQLQYTFVSETKPLWVDEYRVVFRTGVASWQQWWPFESIETVLDANEQVVLTSNGVLIDYVNGGRRIQLPTPTRRWVHVTLQGVGATTLLHNVIVDEKGNEVKMVALTADDKFVALRPGGDVLVNCDHLRLGKNQQRVILPGKVDRLSPIEGLAIGPYWYSPADGQLLSRVITPTTATAPDEKPQIQTVWVPTRSSKSVLMLLFEQSYSK